MSIVFGTHTLYLRFCLIWQSALFHYYKLISLDSYSWHLFMHLRIYFSSCFIIQEVSGKRFLSAIE